MDLDLKLLYSHILIVCGNPHVLDPIQLILKEIKAFDVVLVDNCFAGASVTPGKAEIK